MPADLWKLERFGEKLDYWVNLANPPENIRFTVATWVFSRMENPYAGVKREAGFDNLWFGRVPRTVHGEGVAVGCGYFIHEATHTVVCDCFMSMSIPL